MVHVYAEKKGDSEKLLKYRDLFTSYNNKELLENYHWLIAIRTEVSHQQTLQLISIHKEFNSRFGKSPIKIKRDRSINGTGEIVEKGESYTPLLQVKLYLTDHQIQYLPIDTRLDLQSDFIEVRSFIQPDQNAYLFTCTHSKINTQVVLTGVTPYAILYFDEFLEFKGASLSTASVEGNFVIQTQYKTMLLLKLPLEVDLHKVIKLDYDH
jgi:hypothetical protein